MALSRPRGTRGKSVGKPYVIGGVLVVLMFIIVLQFGPAGDIEVLLSQMESTVASTATASTTGSSSTSSWLTTNGSSQPYDPRKNPLAPPEGKAQNLPSIRVEESATEQKRSSTTKYGGAGDKQHLGGFTEFDVAGVSPALWKKMIQELGVRSLLDVGCGRGTSTTWFLKHGVDVLCAEGSHDAVEKTFLPDPATQVVEHDFSRGPWWPEKTYDAAWAVEFLEHVGVQYHFNYITAFRKAALLFVTSSRWGGWHHVEVHSDEWWIRKYESYGFRYDESLTAQARAWAKAETRDKTAVAPNGEQLNAQHIWLSMKVFINPAVASLPEHAHLFPEFGCYAGREDGEIKHRECGTGRDGKLETALPSQFYPLKLTPQMDEDWAQLIRTNIATDKASPETAA